jgi:hypothetical protein
MLPHILLIGVFAGFLIVFWFTPVGVPTLKRLGGGQMPPDLRFTYGPELTYRLLNVYGARGVAHWRRMLFLDMIFPGVYAALFALLATDWANWVGAGPVWRWVAFSAPILAGASDYIENVLLFVVLNALPRQIPGVVRGASFFTSVKFLFCYATLAIPLVHWVVVRMGWLG